MTSGGLNWLPANVGVVRPLVLSLPLSKSPPVASSPVDVTYNFLSSSIIVLVGRNTVEYSITGDVRQNRCESVVIQCCSVC